MVSASDSAEQQEVFNARFEFYPIHIKFADLIGIRVTTK